jgi:hypothetical protein
MCAWSGLSEGLLSVFPEIGLMVFDPEIENIEMEKLRLYGILAAAAKPEGSLKIYGSLTREARPHGCLR